MVLRSLPDTGYCGVIAPYIYQRRRADRRVVPSWHSPNLRIRDATIPNFSRIACNFEPPVLPCLSFILPCRYEFSPIDRFSRLVMRSFLCSPCLLCRRTIRNLQLNTTLVPRRILATSTTNPAPIDIPKLIISPGSTHHNSLPSFLEYATRKNLAPTRTVYVGTHYEYTVALSLLRLGFSLLRTGRRSDAGIDLIGHWVLPPLREPLPIIAQCKVRTRGCTCSPQNIRELEGSFQGIPADWRKKDVLGLLVTTQNASRGVLDALRRSRWPLGFVKISREGAIEQFLWNQVASQRGLEGVGVTTRHTPKALLGSSQEQESNEGNGLMKTRKGRKKVAEKFKNAGTVKDIQLTWIGTPIFPEREGLDEETTKLMGFIAPEDNEPLSKRTISKPTTGVRRAAASKSAKKTASVAAKRGRPLGSPNKTKTATTITSATKRGRGRPPGAKNKGSTTTTSATKRGRGRPPGSKNKAKDALPNG